MSHDTTQARLAQQGAPSGQLDEIFARRLRALRLAAGLTQQQLAGQAGMHRSAIAKSEAGDRVVPVGEAFRLAGALGTSVRELVTDPGDGTGRARADAQVRLRAAEHDAARRRDLLEEARLLYAHALEVLEEARQQLAAADGKD